MRGRPSIRSLLSPRNKMTSSSSNSVQAIFTISFLRDGKEVQCYRFRLDPPQKEYQNGNKSLQRNNVTDPPRQYGTMSSGHCTSLPPSPGSRDGRQYATQVRRISVFHLLGSFASSCISSPLARRRASCKTDGTHSLRGLPIRRIKCDTSGEVPTAKAHVRSGALSADRKTLPRSSSCCSSIMSANNFGFPLRRSTSTLEILDTNAGWMRRISRKHRAWKPLSCRLIATLRQPADKPCISLASTNAVKICTFRLQLKVEDFQTLARPRNVPFAWPTRLPSSQRIQPCSSRVVPRYPMSATGTICRPSTEVRCVSHLTFSNCSLPVCNSRP